MSDERGRIQQFGCHVSSLVADLAANPFAQIGFILLCIAWFWFDLNVGVLTAALSILAITLTQMVLNSQKDREADDHRRDVAMHAKLDELLIAMKGARDEMAGIEELDEEEIVELKATAQEQLDTISEELKERAGGAGETAPAGEPKTGSRNAA